MRRALTLLVVIAGCGDDERVSPDSDTQVEVDSVTSADITADVDVETVETDPAAQLAELADRWCGGSAEVFCESTVACGCGDVPGYPDAAACLASYDAQCRAQLDPYRGAVLSGQARVDLDAVLPCVALLDTLARDCTRLPNDTFFVDCPIVAPAGGLGELPAEGVACLEGGLCAHGLRCDTAGLCRVPGGVAAACDGPTECLTSLVCADGTCRAPDLAAAGTTCAGPDACAGDTVCMRGNTRVCAVIVADAPCTYDTECLATQYCPRDGGACLDRPTSGPCGNDSACAAGLACGGDPRECRALPTAGDECADGSSGPVLCADGLACNNNVCGDVPALGDPCAIGTPTCGPGLGCAFEAEGSFCRAPAPVNSPCQNDPTCASDLFCSFDDGTCQPHLARGAPCRNGNECGPDAACLPDATSLFRCADAPGVGDRCYLDECGAGRVCQPVFATGTCVRPYCGTIGF